VHELEVDWRVRARRRVARSPLARVAAFPVRAGMVAKHNAASLRHSARWLVRSREHTNITYELTELNREHLAWYVAVLADQPVHVVRGHLAELDGDVALHTHLREAARRSDRRGLVDEEIRFGRRAGWYALVRCLRPAHVVETGTDKGLGSCVLAAALLANGSGRLTTIDINPDSGTLISSPYDAVITRLIGDSTSLLTTLADPVDVFIHDSDHAPAYERSEFEAVTGRLAPDALVLSDNAHETNELAAWAERTGRRFSFFGEKPAHHWLTGDGIGAAYR
jgi:predicted O-methyltransferase YrrM